MLSPPLSPPGLSRGPQRAVGKNSALKLITTFGDQGGKAKFFSRNDDGQTPIAAGVTPIAESAIDQDPMTAVMRGNRSGLNTPTSHRSFASSAYNRGAHLPAIGEANGDVSATAPKNPAFGYGNNANPEPLAERESLRNDTFQHVPPPDASVSERMEQSISNRRNGSRGRIPAGLNLHIEPNLGNSNQSKYHWPSRRRGPGSVSSAASISTTATRSTRGGSTRPLDTYIHSLDAASNYNKKGKRRDESQDRQTTASEQTIDRGRTPVQYPAKKSPTSPVPMSPEELVVLSSAKYTDAPPTADPIKYRESSTKSRTSNRGGSRQPSLERRAATGEPRNRTPGPLETIRIMSPTSPPPMSAMPQLDDTEDEEDYRRAVEAQEKFRLKHSISRGLATPTTAEMQQSRQDRSRSRSRRETSNSRPSMSFRGGSVEHMGDLKAVKLERQRRKEQAARELEQRRRELVENSQAGPITHPSDLAPAFRYTAVEMSTTANSPPRARTADPMQAMYGRGKAGTPQIGLPATPKAMRLVLDSEHPQGGSSAPAVPPIPQSYMQMRAEDDRLPSSAKSQGSAKREPAGLTLLPSTVYQPPRGPLPRSMSAPPIQDEPAGRGHRSSNSRSGGLARNPSVKSKAAEDTQDVRSFSRRESRDLQRPPPPPGPPGPFLRELQHLAMPPPPPPAPLAFAAPQSQGNGALASGMIEIVMDDEATQAPAPIHIPPTEIMVPIIPPPAPPSVKGHNRGRSVTDASSISGRISKATERLRSASRSRKDTNMRAQKSPEFAPYESIQPPHGLYTQMGMRSPPIDPSTLPTGLERNEMI